MTVPVPGRSYDVTIGSGLLPNAGEHLPALPAATTAFEVWLASPEFSLDKALRTAFDELASGFRSLDGFAPDA